MMAMAALCPVKVAGSPSFAARHHQALLSTNNNLQTWKSAASRPPVKPRNAIAQGCRVMCMQVWPPVGIRKYETLSYLKPLSEESVLKQIDYIVSKGWIPCLEFDCEGQIHRTNSRMPGYYDGRYWTLWKLPMFGCTDSAQVMRQINECKKAYPNAYIRCLGFDNKRQTQCIAFVVHRPSASA